MTKPVPEGVDPETLRARLVLGLRDVMDHLTQCVKEFDGVVVDYVGDGMLAMWNAPRDQADHAERACRAALAMQTGMHDVSARWLSVTRKPLRRR